MQTGWKTALGAAVSAATLTGSLYGESNFCCDTIAKACEECYAYNPPGVSPSCCGWNAGFDLLYLKFHQECRDIAEQVNASYLTWNHQQYTGSLEAHPLSVQSEWEGGFRFYAGYTGPCDCWSLNIVYTHFHPEAAEGSGETYFLNAGETSRGAYLLLPHETNFGQSADALQDHQRVAASLKLRLNQVDLEATRGYFVGRCVVFQPIFGVRTLFLREKYALEFDAVRFEAGSNLPEVTLRKTLKAEHKLSSIGLKAGFTADYALGCGLSLYGSMTTALLLGEYESTDRSLFVRSEGSEHSLFDETTHTHVYGLAPMVDFAVGVSWTQELCAQRSQLSLRAGVEEHLIYGMNREQCDGNDLALYGFVLGVDLQF